MSQKSLVSVLLSVLICQALSQDQCLIVYDRNRIFGRNFRPNWPNFGRRKFRPTCRTFGQVKTRKNEAKIKDFERRIMFLWYDLVFQQQFSCEITPKNDYQNLCFINGNIL